MKFLSLLVLAAAGAVCAAPARKPQPQAQQAACNAICTAEYQPVYCDDETTHENLCAYESAKSCNPSAFKNVSCYGGM